MKRFSIAPMLDWTTPSCRVLHRLICPEALLYSEMISTGAVIYGDAERHLRHGEDAPCILQWGGANPDELQRACEIAQVYDYFGFNLNVGCPSDRVQNHQIGAVLMREPRLVAECLSAMAAVSASPVSVKHRLAIDEMDERYVFDFIETVAAHSPCRIFIVHARKAWLQGLSPKANREIPPLNYPLVYEVKKRFPELEIVLNGGITTIEDCAEHLKHVDGVMLGRAAYQNPELLLHVPKLWGEQAQNRSEMLEKITICLEEALARGERLSDYTRHLLGLFPQQRGAKRFRQILSEEARLPDADLRVWQRALQAVAHED